MLVIEFVFKVSAKIHKATENTFFPVLFIRIINTFALMIHKFGIGMNKFKIGRLLIGGAMMLVASACSSSYQIQGNSSITTLDGKMLFLKRLQPDGWQMVDSTEVVHGLFTMEGPVDSVRMVTLYMDDEGIMPLILENGRIEVSISNSQLLAKGTPMNDALYEFIDRRNSMEMRMEELERKEARMLLDGADYDETRAQLTKEAEALHKEMDDYVKKFIADNYETVLGPSVFLMMCATLPYPMMTPLIEDIVRTAPASFTGHPLVRDFLDKARENMQLMEEHRRLSSAPVQ